MQLANPSKVEEGNMYARTARLKVAVKRYSATVVVVRLQNVDVQRSPAHCSKSALLMTSESVVKETPVASADKVVSASKSSIQDTEEAGTNALGAETSVSKQEVAAATEEDVEMKEASDAAKADVDMALVDEEKAEADGSQTQDEDAASDSAKEAENKEDTATDEKPVENGDAEMKGNDEAPEAEVPASPAKNETSATTASENNTQKESEQTGAESKDTNNSQSPKRKEAVEESISEISNGVNGVATPTVPTHHTAKKQKVDAANPNPSEKASADTATPGSEGSSPSVMLSRDDMAKMEEDNGRLKFDVITNDGTDEHMIQLTTLKNIFAKQLPKMPKEYIVRLVFDKNHRSMLLLKNGTHVIGGICYRPFEKNQFAEIAFCAINASDQVKGYGTRLMNHLKEYVKTKNITHFLTYADNYAIGYFKKQGFTKSVSMARPNWYGYIKDYDGGTLMECTIHTKINYLRITSMIHMQRKAIQDKIQERSRAKTVYPGLTQFAEGRLMDIYMVPGVKEAGWSQAVIRNNRIGTRDQGSLKSQLSQLLKAVSNHRSAWPFHEPVDTSVVVDYLEHIKEPVDLQLVSKRIDNGNYISKAALKADLEKMCDNCTTYNTPDTNYYKAAVDLREFIQSRIQIRDHK